MLLGKKTLLTASLAFAFALVTRNVAAQDLNSVLAKLDAAATNFHSTSANFEFDSYQTDPVPDTDVQKGTVYYDRKSGADCADGRTSMKTTASLFPKSSSFQAANSSFTKSLLTRSRAQKRPANTKAICCSASAPAAKIFRKNVM